jgi:hypothetical protein
MEGVRLFKEKMTARRISPCAGRALPGIVRREVNRCETASGTAELLTAKELVMTLLTGRRVIVGLLGLAGLLGLWGAAASPVHAINKSDSVVKISAAAAKPDADGKQVVTITLEMDQGWHTYANPVGLKDLDDNATTVKFTGNNKPQKVLRIDYPKGTPFKDKAFGTFFVYEGKAVIKATVLRAKGDSSPLEVSVSINACNDKSCLQPATVKRIVK